MALRVFVSHQWRDKQIADRLQQAIEGLTPAEVWLDYRNLRPGDKIQDVIDEVLAGMDVVLVLWSPHSDSSAGVQAEIETAIRNGMRIIPCFISYDAAGNPNPNLEPPLSDYLGVDFFHFETGVATLASYLLELDSEKSQLDMGGDRKMQMVSRMREVAGYLANYRSATGVSDERRYWLAQVVAEVEQYTRDTGDTDMAALFLGAMGRLRETDPEAYEVAAAKLRPLTGGASSPAEPKPVRAPGPVSAGSTDSWKPGPPARDALDQALAAAGVGDQLASYRASVEAYLSNAEPALQAMTNTVYAVGSAAGIQVVGYLNGYLQQADDLIPDHHGMYGYLDDAWLILNTAFRLIESGALTVAQVPVDWQTVIAVDPIVRSLIPAQALAALEQHMLQMLGLIAAEIAAYQPWMTPAGHGYSPTMASGGSWEDQMNAGFAELGVSW